MSRATHLALAVAFAWPAEIAATTPSRNYYVYVCAESDDTVHKLRYGPGGLQEIKKIPVGSFPAETEGPHGISVSPDKKHWFVSIAHGMPFGSIHKYEAETDEWLADVPVGMFPATMAVSPATGLLFVVNFDLHGDMKPSTISVVETSTMLEVARIDTGTMPHGARMNGKGTRLYSVNMMDDNLVEVDALAFEVSRTLSLAPEGNHEGHDAAHPSSAVKPTWSTVPTADSKLYVAGNGNHTIYEIDLPAWRVSRTFDAGAGMGPYNLEVTSDGKVLLATYKSGAHVGIWDLPAGKERARIKTTRTVPHGVAVSDDDRYAFVTLEGVGGEPGTVEVYDLATDERVAQADVGKQAGGITFWKGEP
ncbi:MAG TPA: YncE family protein [Vicinamibacteria bacterium]|nr:YncE family protein [Vicinamibacteria bacterium]